MHVLDGVLHRDDVIVAGAVHVIEDACERGRLAAARGAGDEHHPALEIAKVQNLLGNVHLLGIGQAERDHAHDRAERTALTEDVRAEAPHTGHGKAEIVVVVAVRAEVRDVAAGDIVDRRHVLLGVARHERCAVGANVDAALLVGERESGDDEHIGGMDLDHLFEQVFELHGFLLNRV